MEDRQYDATSQHDPATQYILKQHKPEGESLEDVLVHLHKAVQHCEELVRQLHTVVSAKETLTVGKGPTDRDVRHGPPVITVEITYLCKALTNSNTKLGNIINQIKGTLGELTLFED